MKLLKHHVMPPVSMLLMLACLMTAVVMRAPSASAQTADANWKLTGGLNAARHSHTATLLRNGKVLVAGGYSAGPNPGVLSSAELYDPATETWSDTGSLLAPRVSHTATLLPDGRVLVVGDGNVSAEVYDPTSGTWSATGNLNFPRILHTATLLQNGKVLVAGGWDGASVLKSAEVYDPATGAWSLTGSLGAARYLSSATLLQNGKVLVAGGSDDSDFSSTLVGVEVYDPEAGTWSPTGSLNAARDTHAAAALPDGRVLVVGGENWNRGFPPGALSGAEVYDPAAGTWGVIAGLNAGRGRHTATLLNGGEVLVVGGEAMTTAHAVLGSAETYESAAGTNPIDDATFFVRQHYRDFLNREPDDEGLRFWTDQINSCGADAQCREVKRINVSAAFFLSIEFQRTGYLVDRFYFAAYSERPRLSEFLSDSRLISQGVVVNSLGWEERLESNERAFADAFVARARFADAYPASLTPEEFVGRLNANAGAALSADKRDSLAADLRAGAKTRAEVLKAVAEDEDLARAEFDPAFVLMQYYGYLRRNPDDLPDSNMLGYIYWLRKLDDNGGDFARAEMVKAFISSAEYRQRFGRP
jgi:N-acetylneuraminic acid mutarotase